MSELVAEQDRFNTSKILGYSGLIPFCLTLLVSLSDIFDADDLNFAFIAYSAVILSFVAGTFWHGFQSHTSIQQKALSNIFCLVAFTSLLISYPYALILQMVNYSLLFIYEKTCLLGRTNNYIALRLNLTVAVVTLHLIALLLWLN